MKPDDLIVLRTFPNVIDAELAKGALDAAHVEAIVQRDDAAGIGRHSAKQLRLLVRAKDAEKALGIIGPRWT